jgi:hypothetical protein
MVAPELPRAGRRELEPRGHVTAPELPQAERQEPGPWDTRACSPALPFILTWSLYTGIPSPQDTDNVWRVMVCRLS